MDAASVTASTGTEITPRWHTTMEIGLSASVLIFGILLMALEVLYLRNRTDVHPVWALKLFGLTLVITAGLFLIVAGFSQNQTASMMGLLGTVAGYLLGKDVNYRDDSAPLAQKQT
ncbi:MAG: hypothetical protein IIC50_17395 [Planctomycetes bacterium]|nr:hypothetical protein [Planctomycetota bacterium]